MNSIYIKKKLLEIVKFSIMKTSQPFEIINFLIKSFWRVLFIEKMLVAKSSTGRWLRLNSFVDSTDKGDSYGVRSSKVVQ